MIPQDPRSLRMVRPTPCVPSIEFIHIFVYPPHVALTMEQDYDACLGFFTAYPASRTHSAPYTGYRRPELKRALHPLQRSASPGMVRAALNSLLQGHFGFVVPPQ